MPRNRDVFLNTPFDSGYRELFEAICFTLLSCGFRPRCALETLGSNTSRLEKICNIIQECGFGIHDISRVEPGSTGLPRFNMPFELGLFIACKRFGGPAHSHKQLLILDREAHTHHTSFSDLSGYDPVPHDGTVDGVIRHISAWLRPVSRDPIPGPAQISGDFLLFRHDLPSICVPMGFDELHLNFRDLLHFQYQWLSENERSAAS